jgi:hypothetical protein
MDTICGATFVFDHEGEPDLIENELTGGAYRVLVGITKALRGLLIYSPGDAEHIMQPV